MYTLLSLLAYIALACAVIALWKPKLYPLGNPTPLKGFGFYFALFACFFLFAGSPTPKNPQNIQQATATGVSNAPTTQQPAAPEAVPTSMGTVSEAAPATATEAPATATEAPATATEAPATATEAPASVTEAPATVAPVSSEGVAGSSKTKSNLMYTLLMLLSYIALAAAVISLWKPSLCPLSKATPVKAFAFYFALFALLFLLAGKPANEKNMALAPKQAEQDTSLIAQIAEKKFVPGEALAWAEISREATSMLDNKRARLHVTIVPLQEQEKATQTELLATVKEAAMQLQKETRIPVVVVNMLCQKADNAFGELQLAQAVYIPDGKGFDGTSKKQPTWETLRTAMRGFTKAEREYLNHRAAMYKAFQGSTGIQEKALDTAICKKMTIPTASLAPLKNVLKDTPTPETPLK